MDETADGSGLRGIDGVLAAGLLLLAIVLQLWAASAQSLSGDGAYHLLAGHQALRYGQNTLNLEHPPLVKLLVSAPLLLEDEPLAPPMTVDRAITESTRIYEDRDRLDRVTRRSRAIALVFFVLPLAVGCWLLGRRFAGPRGGWLLVLTLGCSFSVVPILGSLQTDAAVSAATVWLLLTALFHLDRPGWRSAALMGLALGIAMSSKFSGALLVPTVVAAVSLAPDPTARWRRRAGRLVIAASTALVVIHIVGLAANRHYDRVTGRAVITDYCTEGGTLFVGDRLQWAESSLLALERFDPPLAQWLTGFFGVRAQNAEGAYLSYAFGTVTRWGRWWYFPAVLLIKTPLVLLFTAVWAAARTTRARGQLGGLSPGGWLVVLTASVYLITAVTSNYNLGFRHLLPVLPLLYLPLIRWLSGRSRAAWMVVLVLAAESLVVAPIWMCVTNAWWLGSRNPTRIVLGTGNTEYRQNFVTLAHEVEDRDLGQLKVLYPVLPSEVLAAYLPTARIVEPGDPLDSGWYAVNVIVEQLAPAILEAPEENLPQPGVKNLAREWFDLWAVVRRGEDHGYIAGTFHLYRLDQRHFEARPETGPEPTSP